MAQWWRISQKLGPYISKKFIITDQTNFQLAHTTEPPGHTPLFVNVVVAGPFKEEEEGTRIASEIVEAKGEDQDTPGYLKGDRVRKDVSNFQSWVRLPWFSSRGNPENVIISQCRWNKTKNTRSGCQLIPHCNPFVSQQSEVGDEGATVLETAPKTNSTLIKLDLLNYRPRTRSGWASTTAARNFFLSFLGFKDQT